jgi:hypothetical protein
MKIYKNILLINFIFISCATINEVVNPLQNPLTSWIFDKSCIAVDVPPITLTSEKTSIERQILGEKTELYPDGWLIVSPNYVSVFQENAISEPTIKKNLEVLTLYRDTLEYYVFREYIGIDDKKNFVIVPDRFRKQTDLKDLQIARELVQIINYNKNRVYDYLVAKDKKIAEDFTFRYLKLYQEVGWNYDVKMGWYKK